MSRSPEYIIWQQMKKRCFNASNPAYHNYGGRGIVVCARWRNDFAAFLDDMGKRPSEQHSLDRINNDGNYEPGNCRWATGKEQMNNCRINVFVEFNGKTQTLVQWARELGLPDYLPSARLRHGWTVERALTSPVRR